MVKDTDKPRIDPASSTVAHANASDAPPNVEVPEQSHVRTTTPQDQDLPVGLPAAGAAPNVVPNLRPEGTGPTGLAVGEVKTNTAKKDQLSAFLAITGYKASDVIGSSADRRTFVTSNGGKYELSPKGKKVRVLSGPIPLGPKKDEEEDDD